MDLDKIYKLAKEDKIFSNKLTDEESYLVFRDIWIDVAHNPDAITKEILVDFQDVLRKIARGQITYDKEKMSINFRLTVPVKVGDDTFTSLTFKKPTLHKLREGKLLIKDIDKDTVMTELFNKLIPIVTDCTSVVVQDLHARDFYIAGHISSLFFL